MFANFIRVLYTFEVTRLSNRKFISISDTSPSSEASSNFIIFRLKWRCCEPQCLQDNSNKKIQTHLANTNILDVIVID